MKKLMYEGPMTVQITDGPKMINANEMLVNNNYKGPQNSVTPYILEERQMNMTQMDVFSRLMKDRIIWILGPVNEQMAATVQAQLIFLDNLDPNKTIQMHIDTPGGCVKSGLSIVDVMNYIDAPVATINTGMAASMGSILVGAGEPGMRASLPSSRIMLHQSSGGIQGNVQDADVTWEEWIKLNNHLLDLLGGYCGKTAEQIRKDTVRDFWLSGPEAVQYGLIDKVITSKKELKS